MEQARAFQADPQRSERPATSWPTPPALRGASSCLVALDREVDDGDAARERQRHSSGAGEGRDACPRVPRHEGHREIPSPADRHVGVIASGQSAAAALAGLHSSSSAHHRTGEAVGGGPCLVLGSQGDGGYAAANAPGGGRVESRCLMRQRAGAVDGDDATRIRAAAGSARPDAILVQSSRYCSPGLLDKVQPALRLCMGAARANRSGRSTRLVGIVWGR